MQNITRLQGRFSGIQSFRIIGAKNNAVRNHRGVGQ